MSAQSVIKILSRVELLLPVAIIAIMGWLSYRTNVAVQTAFDAVTHNYDVLGAIEQTQIHITDIETGQRGYLLTGREGYLAPYQAAKAALDDDLGKLKALTGDNPAQQTWAVELRKLIERRLSLAAQTIATRKTNEAAAMAFVLTDQGKNTMDRIRQLFAQMRQEEGQGMIERQKNVSHQTALDRNLSLVFTGMVVLILAIIVLVLYRLERLQRFVTVCAWTGQVKYEGKWIRMDEYLKRRYGISVSHGISEEAEAKMLEEIQKANSIDSP